MVPPIKAKKREKRGQIYLINDEQDHFLIGGGGLIAGLIIGKAVDVTATKVITVKDRGPAGSDHNSNSGQADNEAGYPLPDRPVLTFKTTTLSEAKINEVLSLKRGERDEAATYMSSKEISDILNRFDEGKVGVRSCLLLFMYYVWLRRCCSG